MNHPLTLDENTCKEAKESVRYLGVEIDRKLLWNQHIKEIRTKDTKSIGGLARIAGSIWGGNYKAMRQLYQAIVIPQISYCCSAWYQTENTHGHNKSHLQALQRVQAQAARKITGAFKATSGPALDVETHLLPVKHLLDKLTFEAVLRIATSPSYNDIIKPRLQQWKFKRKPRKNRKTSPLEKHTERLEKRQFKIELIEKLRPFSASPNWNPPKTVIHKTKEEARKLVETSIGEGMMFYTDGSGINKKVGAAAVSPSISTPFMIYLDRSEWYTVYSAELHGTIQALAMAVTYRAEVPSNTVIINTDNQASLQAINAPGKLSGQVYVIQAVALIDMLRSHGIDVELHWIPAHIGIDGNENADRKAKEATGWRERKEHGRKVEVDTDETAEKSVIQARMISTVRTAINTYAHEQWASDWTNESRGSSLRKIQPTPTHRIKQLHHKVKRAKSSLITQIRTEKIGLKAFLYNRRVPGIEDESCECGATKQTVRHVLHECKLFYKQRRKWGAEVRRKSPDGVISHKEMITTPRYASMAADFMRSTGLIGQYQVLDEEQKDGFIRM